MNIMQPEQLFLLEFLVDSLYVHRLCGREINQREWLSAGQTVITFQFLNFQMQAISDNDFPCPGTATGGPQKFESGKSCLFSIPDKDLSAPGKFIVYVGILKRQPPGIVPETLLVGEAQIDITDQFTTVLSEIVAHPKEVPASSAIKEPFVIHYPETNEPVGQIHLFIRLSCFGKSIVTEFSLGSGQSYLFKGNEDSIYRCQAVDGPGANLKSGGDSVTGCGKSVNSAGCLAAAGGGNAMNYGGGGYPPYGPPMSNFAQTGAYPSYGMVNPSAGYSGTPPRGGGGGVNAEVSGGAPMAGGGMGGMGGMGMGGMAMGGGGGAPLPSAPMGGGGGGCGGQRALPCGHSTPPSTFNPCGAGGFFVQIPQCKPGPGPCSDVAIYKLTKRAPGDPGMLGADPGMPGGPGGGIGGGPTGGALVPCDAPTPDAYVLRIKRTCPRGCDQRELLELACRPPPAPPAAAAATQAAPAAAPAPKKNGKKGKKGKKK